MYQIAVLLFPLLFLSGCSGDLSSNQEKTENTTYLVQAISQAPAITDAIKGLTPLINNVIKQELQLDEEYDFAFFIPKKLQRVSLYYLNDVNQKNINMIVGQLDKLGILRDISLEALATSTPRFFGDQQDELVIMIDDITGNLAALNQKIKQSMHKLNEVYYMQHGQDFYNISRSERFSFMPHMGLGRIRSQSIKNHIKDSSQIKDTFERIKSRILLLTREKLESLFNMKSLPIFFEKMGLLDLKKQSYVKEWV
jgi:hypothetical protein